MRFLIIIFLIIVAAILLGAGFGFISYADDYQHPPTEQQIDGICYGRGFFTPDGRYVIPPPLDKISKAGQEICAQRQARWEESLRQIDREFRAETERALQESVRDADRALHESENPK